MNGGFNFGNMQMMMLSNNNPSYNSYSQSEFKHVSIVNLVIGSLYCSKGNYEFGLTLMMKSIKPLETKLGTDSWYYIKRCILAMIERVVRKRISIDEKLFDSLIAFFD